MLTIHDHMNQEELNKLSEESNISIDKIIREELEMIFLYELSKSNLSSKLVFYGGTALRLVYNSPRFSEDIDLLMIKSIDFDDFSEFMNRVVKKNPLWSLKDIKDKRNTIFGLILIKEPKLKYPLSLKIEIYKNPKLISLETELSIIKSPTSILSPLLLVPKLEELKRLKEDALLDRKKARDVFDLWYIAKTLRQDFSIPNQVPKFSKKEFENELKVFLPKDYYPIIDQLYEKIDSKDK